MKIKFGRCPTCLADPTEPCRSPSGRIRENKHDDRAIVMEISQNEVDQNVFKLKELEQTALRLGIITESSIR